YTYFRTTDSSKVSLGFQTANSVAVSGHSSASYSGKVSYNALDLILGKAMFMSSRVSIRPYIGLKNAWISQRYILNDLNFIDLTTLSGDVNMRVVDKDKVWGIGPEAGWDLGLYCTKSLSLLAIFEGALLQGYFNVTEGEVLDIIPVGSTATQSVTNLRGNKHQFIPYGRMLLGVNWGRVFNGGNQRIDVSLNYEINYFWRINQMLNQATSIGSADGVSTRVLVKRWTEDLAFYGVTFKVNFGF
ncbi:MAG: Lpg1974 family pore-forming outer membrane protein, partial [Chlamydiota bacterium]